MAQTETRTDPTRAKSTKTSDFLQIGTKRLESIAKMQKELLNTFEQVQRDRLDRTMQETELASEFASKVAGAKSIGDILAVYQEWIARRMETFAEDGRKFFDDSQKIANATLRLLSNGDGDAND